LDFGLAKLTAPQANPAPNAEESTVTTALITPAGVLMGTPDYMAPEQVRGQSTDYRSDIFSFGLVLHEMLTGVPTFRGASRVEVMNAILHDEPSDLSDSVSPQIDAIVRRCLAKSAEERFDTARDLAFALEVLSGGTRAKEEPDTRPRKTATQTTSIAA